MIWYGVVWCHAQVGFTFFYWSAGDCHWLLRVDFGLTRLGYWPHLRAIAAYCQRHLSSIEKSQMTTPNYCCPLWCLCGACCLAHFCHCFDRSAIFWPTGYCAVHHLVLARVSRRSHFSELILATKAVTVILTRCGRDLAVATNLCWFVDRKRTDGQDPS